MLKTFCTGEDKITYEMLQKLPKCLIKVVLKLFNQIWLKNDFPVSWQHSVILPVLKAGQDPLKLHHIGLTPRRRRR